jgi:7-keto-8-aminopelargonate synthetase-like enzyme
VNDWQHTSSVSVKHSLVNFPVSLSSCRTEFGTARFRRECEQTVLSFLGKEDALVFNMGFN